MPKAPGRRSKEKKMGVFMFCLYVGAIHVVWNKFPILSSIERGQTMHNILCLVRVEYYVIEKNEKKIRQVAIK